jgi:hypothetical protein
MGSTFAVEIAPETTARLTAEVWVAFKSIPRRGLEIGGILLGSVHQEGGTTTFRIEAYEAVESEHRFGPSYVMSEPDQVRLGETLARHPGESIGAYRSHTRSQEPGALDSDSTLLQQAPGIFLVLCPSLKHAAFFVQTSEGFVRISEFALESAVSSVLSGRQQHPVEVEPPRSMRSLARIVRQDLDPSPVSLPLPKVAARRPFSRTVRTRRSSKPAWAKDWLLGLGAAALTFGLGLTGALFFAGGVPSLSAQPPQELRPVLVNVKVWVNDQGNVKRAEVLSPGTSANEPLAAAALAAARAWTSPSSTH